MFESRAEPWSNNPNAPKISHRLYLEEKCWFAGHLMASMLYGTRDPSLHVCLSVPTSTARFALGIQVILFFKCMAALFNPVYRKGEGIKWGLVTFTVVMFSLETVVTSMSLNNLSVSYIDNREFPGVERVPSPGPLAYQVTHYFNVTNVVPNFGAVLNSWLADGLLVSTLFDAALRPLARPLTPVPLALSLLHFLLQEHLGHRLPLPHVP